MTAAERRASGTRWSELAVGLVVGGVLTGAVLLSLYWGPRHGLAPGGEPLRFHVVLEEAHGLHVGSPVRVSGVDAGEVTDVRIERLPRLGWRVLVAVELFRGARYREMLGTGSTYAVARPSPMGGRMLAIAPGGGGEPLRDGMLVRGTPPVDLASVAADLGAIVDRLSRLLGEEGRGAENLERALEDLRATLQNLRNLSERFGK